MKQYNIRFKKVTHSQEFLKTMKLFRSDEVAIHSKILIVDNDKVILNATEIAKAFSNCSENTVKTHDIEKDWRLLTINSNNPVDIAI